MLPLVFYFGASTILKPSQSTAAAVPGGDVSLIVPPNCTFLTFESGIRVQVINPVEQIGKVLISGNTIIDEAGIANWGIETRGLKNTVISNNAVYAAAYRDARTAARPPARPAA